MSAANPEAPAGKPARQALLDGDRYALAAIVLHWTIALMIVVQLFLGWWMNEWVPDHSRIQDQIQWVHVSLGITILILVLIRIAIRIAVPPPPVPADIPGWERPLINFTHSLFYVLLIVLPLTGWALISLSKEGPSLWGLPWPRLPGLGFLAHNKPWRHDLKSIHTYWLIWIVLLNLALHVAGALRHQFDGHPVLWRMLPGRAKRAG
ncbi:MAG: cytochrome b [Caulobacteraceae bacterium]